MTPDDRLRFPAIVVTLKDGAPATIRPLLSEDGEALGACYAEIPRHNIRFYGPYPLTRAQALDNASRADSPNEVVLVLERPAGQIGGYAWYRWEPDDEVSLFGICLHPSCQELGAGGKLMTRLAEIAREIGPPVMGLTVQLANTRALRLYRSMGFTEVREQMCQRAPGSEFVDEPEYYMERRVR